MTAELSISSVNEIYDCSHNIDIRYCSVPHRRLSEFCFSLRRIERKLGDLAEDDYWVSILRFFKRVRFTLLAAPLPFNHPFVCSSEELSATSDMVEKCRVIFPFFSDELQTLFSFLCELLESGENPLMSGLLSLLNSKDNKKKALLLKEIRFVEPVKEEILPKTQLELVRPFQLRKECCFDELFVIGPARWFQEHEYIFTAPRSRVIHIISYKWIKDSWKKRPVFIPGKAEVLTTHTGLFDPGEFVPEFDWDRVSRRLPRNTHPNEIDDVEARLYVLDGGVAVFLDVSLDAKILVIDLEDTRRIRRIRCKEVQPDMFILLRTSGGGDYIVPVADSILGAKAREVRGTQEQWKTALSRKVRDRGMQEVSNALRSLGSLRASPFNIRNWMSSRSIRPQDFSDFQAIMEFIRMTDKTEEFWKNADIIDAAHRQAGFRIRSLLLKEVMRSDPTIFHKSGQVTFELAEADGGSITAFRVDQISPQTYSIPASRVGQLIEEDGYLWQG